MDYMIVYICAGINLLALILIIISLIRCRIKQKRLAIRDEEEWDRLMSIISETYNIDAKTYLDKKEGINTK